MTSRVHSQWKLARRPGGTFPRAGPCQLCSAGSKPAGRSGVFYLGGVGEQDANPESWLPSWWDQAGHTIQTAVCVISVKDASGLTRWPPAPASSRLSRGRQRLSSATTGIRGPFPDASAVPLGVLTSGDG